jgi:hypothetical protein
MSPRIRVAASLTGACVVVVTALLSGTGTSLAASSTAATRSVHAGAQPIHALPTKSQAVATAIAGTDTRVGAPPMIYQGGSIARSMKVYAIYWNPGRLQDGTSTSYQSTTYSSLVNRFFVDFSKTKLANNLTQYYGYSGTTPNVHIGVVHPFKGSFVDTTAFPVGDCSTFYTGVNCVSNYALGREAAAVARAHLIAAGTSTEFFIFTPYGEGSCFYQAACTKGNGDAYGYYCAFHTYTSSTYGAYPNLVYANMPFPIAPGINDCGAPSSPNHDQNADSVINVTSHELNESITDPLLNAWFDPSGYEIGDECSWQFGPQLPSGGDVLWKGGTHPYWVQKEASNASANCVLAGP